MPWSGVTSGGSATTWAGGTSRNSYAWVPYAKQSDLWGGVDFIAKAVDVAPFKLDSTRPIAVWNVSAVTASNFTAEGRP